MKKTKIICSIGPSTQTWDNFKGIVEAGMNVARINFSHATIEERKLDESLVKRANEELGANIAILYDTKGPDLRTCSFVDDKIELIKGNTIRILESDGEDRCDGTSSSITLNYPNILKDLKVGSTILVDDGFYKLIVKSIEEDGVTCEIMNSGTIKSRRGVCLPGIKLDVPYISEKDKEDIKYACENTGDYLAISFVTFKFLIEDSIASLSDLELESNFYFCFFSFACLLNVWIHSLRGITTETPLYSTSSRRMALISSMGRLR